MSYPTILEVVPGSPAAAAGLVVGDELVAVNGVLPSDVIEYQQLVDEPEVDLVVRRAGCDIGLDITKDPGAPLGLRLNSSIFDRVQTCDNHCEFCFIYQLPPGMRKSLYLKDDDYRLSFLYGNFTTLTRFTELDLARVVEERLGPLYVSIHATDPAVRSGMLRNPRGATSLRWLRALLDHDITVHGQIVLCPTINGGEVLAQTCAEILARYPRLASVGIVPLGLSRFNQENSLRVHTRSEAREDLETVHIWQQIALERIGRRMFFASDELYLTAETPFPATEAYEQYNQHENGIGMARAFYDELDRLERGTPLTAPEVTGEWRTVPAAPAEGYRAPRLAGGASQRAAGGDPTSHDTATVVVTGDYGAAVLTPVLDRLERLADTPLRLLPVRNDFFGGNVAVSGLLTGDDVRRAVAADPLAADRYLVPDVALQGGVFLDNVSLDEIAQDVAVAIDAVPATAGGLVAGARR